MGIIYHVFNTVNGKAYIGQTWNGLARRWIEHKCSKKHAIDPFAKALAKYGSEVFVATQLCECNTQEELNAAEAYFIEFFETLVTQFGYNIRSGGSNGKLAESTKEKISKALTGRKLSDEQRAAISEGQRTKRVYPKRYSEVHREAISTGLKNRTLAPEHAEKIRLSHVGMKYKKRVDTGSKRSPESIARMIEAQRLRREKERSTS